MSEPRRYLVAAGTGHYRELDELSGVYADVERVVGLFAAMGYERVLTEVSRDPDAADFEDALADWCTDGGLAAGDVVVVYYAGHGNRPTAGPYRLACAGSTAARPRSWLSLDNLAAILAEAPVRDVLFVVDACNAGLGADELGAVTAAFGAARGGEDPASGTWVLASARRRERARDTGHFTRELARAYAAGDGASQRHLSPALLADRINRALVTAGHHEQRAVCSVTDQSIQPPFFPNPAFDPSAEIGPDGRAEGEVGDLTAHFEPRGRGVEHVHDPGSYFTGRAHALDVVRTRLAGPGGRGPLAVTGAPGSGKSALLGRIVLEGDTSGGTPPIDVSINARHQTIDALIGRLAGAADVRASSVDALLAALAGRQAPYRVVVDSLDEAGPGHDIVEARRIAWELLRPLGDVPCVRLVVGSRRELLSDWCKHAPIVDLDTDTYADDTSVADYVERILADVRSPYADAPDTARGIAQAVARRAGRCFLVARMTASALLRQEPVDVTASGWADALPSDVDGAFRAYLERLPAARRATALTLLTTLAFAEGHGLPRAGVWTAVASRLSGAAVHERDIDELVDEEGSYLTTVDVGDHRYFRLYHQELTDHLRGRALASRDLADIQGCFVETLLSLTPLSPDGTGPNWAKARPYIRFHLATHAAAAGTVGELLTDPAFVLAAGTADLLRAVRRAHEYSMLPLVVELCAQALRNRESDRAAHLAFVARAHGEHEFADRALALSTSVERVSMNPRSVTPHRVIGHHGTGGFSFDSIHPFWWIEELRPRNRHLLAVASLTSNCVHVWVPDDPSAAKTLPHPVSFLGMAAFVDTHDRPVAITLDGSECLRVWDIDDATPMLCVPDTGYAGILGAGALNDGTSVVACHGSDRVDILETTSGRVVLQVDCRASGHRPLPGGGLIRTAGSGVRLPMFHADSGTVVLYDLEGSSAGSPEVLVEGLSDLVKMDIAESSRGETFVALLEGHDSTATRVTLVHLGGRSASFRLPDEARERWSGFVRVDTEPTYLVGGVDRTYILPMSGRPLHRVTLSRTYLSVPATSGTGRAFVVHAGIDNALRVVDAVDGISVGAPLYGHESAIYALRMLASSSVDGLTILAVGTDGTVRVWDWSPPVSTVASATDVVGSDDSGRPEPLAAVAPLVPGGSARPQQELVVLRDSHILDAGPVKRPDDSWAREAVPVLRNLAARLHGDPASAIGPIAFVLCTDAGDRESGKVDFLSDVPAAWRLHIIPPCDAHPRRRLVAIDRLSSTVVFASLDDSAEAIWPLSDYIGSILGGSTAVGTSTGQALLLHARSASRPDSWDVSVDPEVHVRDATNGREAPPGGGRFKTPYLVIRMMPFHSRTGTRYIACVGQTGGYSVLDLTDGRIHVVTKPRSFLVPWQRAYDIDGRHLTWARLPSNDALLVWMYPEFVFGVGWEPRPVHTWNSASPDHPGRLAVAAKRLLWAGNSPNGEALVLLADEHGIALCHLPDGDLIWRTPLPAWLTNATVRADLELELATQQGVVLLRPQISAAWRRRLGLGRG